jgi:hypothetical protein
MQALEVPAIPIVFGLLVIIFSGTLQRFQSTIIDGFPEFIRPFYRKIVK